MTDRIPSETRSTVHFGSSPLEATCNRPPTWDPETELDVIYQEIDELRHGSASEDAVSAHLGERLQALNAIRNKETSEVLAEIQSTRASAMAYRDIKRYDLLVIVAVVAVFGGLILETTIGRQFVFSASNQYRAAIPWLLALLTPMFAWMFFFLERANHTWANRYPTRWVRWLIVFPGTVTVSSVITISSPLGWLALYGWLFGTPSVDIEAKMLSIGTYHSSSRGCHQHAEIIITGNSANICLDKVISGRVPAAGETVSMAGHISKAGVFIDEIRAR